VKFLISFVARKSDITSSNLFLNALRKEKVNTAPCASCQYKERLLPTLRSPLRNQLYVLKECASFRFCRSAIRKGVLWCSWVRQCATRQDVRVSIHGVGLGNFQVASYFCPHSIALRWTRHLLGGKVLSAPWPDKTAGLGLSNVKVKMEPHHSIVPPLSLHQLLLGKLYIYLILYENIT
jgi:hypothetical protein